MNVANWLFRRAILHPDRPALFLGERLVASYGTFCDRAARVAGWLAAQGVRPGDRVGLFMKNCPDYLIVQYGIWFAGAAAVPINSKLHGREAAFILENSGAAFCYTSPGLTEALHDANVPTRLIETGTASFDEASVHAPVTRPADRAPQDLAWLFYTSGTTGRPKGVIITHRMLVAMSLAYPVDVDPVSDEDSVIYAAPMSHGAGLYNMIHVRLGARHVCPPSGGFDAGEILDLARHFGCAQMFAAPTMVKRLTDAALDAGDTGAGLRTIVYGGGPMYMADITRAVEHFGPIFVQIYGQGECPMGITALSRHEVTDRTHPRWKARLQSVGRAQSPVEVQIGDADGIPRPQGQPGEIMVRGDVVMPGYWNDTQATEKALKNGWLMTGDIGVLDNDGYLTLRDRSKDMIVTGGSNVYPREVEEVLLTHPGLREVSVVGRPHPEWGEEVVAFVVGNATEDELDRLCIDNVARFKRPKAYRFLSELPKNNYGKVLKTELRSMLESERRRT